METQEIPIFDGHSGKFSADFKRWWAGQPTYSELVTALEALVEAYESWGKTGRARYLERLALKEPAYVDARALLLRLKGSGPAR